MTVIAPGFDVRVACNAGSYSARFRGNAGAIRTEVAHGAGPEVARAQRIPAFRGLLMLDSGTGALILAKLTECYHGR
jgi:hypothetical protein